jgi:hypothetical protein
MLRYFNIVGFFVVVLVLWAAAPAHAQIDGEKTTPGSSCSTLTSNADAADWDTFFECISSVWQRGPYFFGSSADSCDSNHAGMVQYTSGGVLEACNGTSWVAIGLGGPALISTQTASSSATLQWTGLGSTYKYYKLFCTDLILSSTSAVLYLQFGEGATPTWKTSSYHYGGIECSAAAAGSTGCGGFSSTSATGIIISNGATEVWGSNAESIDVTISNLASGLYKNVTGNWAQNVSGGSGDFSLFLVGGQYEGDTTAVTAVRLNPSTGTITSGQCSLYGINS